MTSLRRLALGTTLRRAALLLTLLAATPLTAHEGHDHAEEAPLPGTLAPRFEAVGEHYEVLGVREADPHRLTLYVDRYADNHPATITQLEIEAGEQRLVAHPAAPGLFSVDAEWLGSETPLDLTLTLNGPEGDDLLLGTLPPAVTAPVAAGAAPPRNWLAPATALGGLLLLIILASRRRRHRAPLAGALIAAALASGAPPPAHAHGNEEHAPAEATPTAAPALRAGMGERPQRLPDGSLFLPKTSQRVLAVRTLVARTGEHRPARTLPGQVVADPAHGGIVQAPFAGRIEAPREGLPAPGRPVRRGEVLAWLTPLGSGLEQAGARAQAAELQAQLTLAERRAERLRQLEGSVARKDIEAAAIEADSLRRRLAAIDGALAGREALRAPVDGIVSDTRGVNGAIVDARATLFEIIDPRHLQVEALAHAALPGGTVEASGLAGRGSDAQPLRLGFIGAGRSLREQALPLRFRIEPAAGDAPPLLAVGQPVSVFVRVGAPRTGVALPAEAVVRGPDNQPQVWVHSAAERFEARRVDTQPLSAGEVLVTHGLSGGERVVTTGAALLAQIR